MKDYIDFSKWEKMLSLQESEDLNNATLIAELEDLIGKRKKAIKEKDAYESQILEIEIKLKKIELERSDLMRRQKDLTEAKKISKRKNIEGKTHEQE